jgi:hypothetical protein
MTTVTIDRDKLERWLDALEDAKKNHGLVYVEETVDIREALAQPVQEPVAWMVEDRDNRHFIFRMQKPEVMVGDTLTPLYTTPPAAQPPLPAQEPVGDEWTPCMKLPVVVHVRKQRLGEAHVSTREGITPVKPDDLIMRGVSGEEYPIGRAIFEQTYSLDPTPPAAQPPLPVQKPDAAIKTLEHLKYTYHGGEYWRPPLGLAPAWAQPHLPVQRQPLQLPKGRSASAWGGRDTGPCLYTEEEVIQIFAAHNIGAKP